MRENNIKGYIAHVRDSFLHSEKEFLETLKLQPQFNKSVEAINKMNVKEISDLAMKTIEKIDNGEVPDEKMEEAELYVTMLLASIVDYVRTREEKTRDFTIKEDERE